MERIEQRKNFKQKLSRCIEEAFVPFLLTGLITLGASSSVLSLAAFALAGMYILFAKSEKGLALMFYLAPFANIFKTSPSSSSLFTYLGMLIAVKMIVLRGKINLRFLAGWLILLIYNFIGANGQFTTLIKQAMIPMMLYCFFICEKLDFRKITVYFSWGLMISSVLAEFIGSVPNLSNYVVYSRAYEVDGEVYRFSGLYSDPNYYSLALILAMSGMLLLMTTKQLNQGYYGVVMAFIIFGAQTASKSFILLLAIVGVMYIGIQFRSKKYGFGIVALLVVCIAAFAVLSGRVSIFQTTLNRFMSGDLTTQRTDIWVEYWEVLSSNIGRCLVGFGIGADFLNAHAAHNSYIDFLYYYGIIGTVLFAVVCVLALGRSKNRKFKRTILNYVPIVLMAVGIWALSALMHFDFAFNLAYVMFAYRTAFLMNQTKETGRLLRRNTQ